MYTYIHAYTQNNKHIFIRQNRIVLGEKISLKFLISVTVELVYKVVYGILDNIHVIMQFG
jgi:hypothetical protein